MARPKSIDDEDILEAAREVFLEDGIQATTAEIARRADISEGTIYRRFSTKHELFVAAMDIPDPPKWLRTLQAIDEDDDLGDALERVSLEAIEFFEEIIPKINMVLCNLGEQQLFDSERDAPPLRALEPTTRFFERQCHRGRIRDCNAEIAARMFLGSLFHFAFSEVTGINDILSMPRETYARGVIQNLLHGLQAPADSAFGTSG